MSDIQIAHTHAHLVTLFLLILASSNAMMIVIIHLGKQDLQFHSILNTD